MRCPHCKADMTRRRRRWVVLVANLGHCELINAREEAGKSLSAVRDWLVHISLHDKEY